MKNLKMDKCTGNGFCAKYNSQIVRWVDSNPTPVNLGWKSITKEEAIYSLAATYGTNTDI